MTPFVWIILFGFLLFFSSEALNAQPSGKLAKSVQNAQVPTWSTEDLHFFFHGSMSTEFVPENVLRAFIRIYPDLFSSKDLKHFGLLPDPGFGWPIGFSRSRVKHLGGLPAVGINCAACHVGSVKSKSSDGGARILGMTSLFDAEAFFGAVIVAGFRTADPANMKRFLATYLDLLEPAGGDGAQAAFAAQWQQQESNIVAAITADPIGARNSKSGALTLISGSDLQLGSRLLADGADLSALASSMLKLFHNMRSALHIPDQPPDKMPPASGPGRNDAFGLLSAVLFGQPQPYAPVKYGLVWNLEQRHWVHWDGNTQSPIGRNLLAALGLGAPLFGHRGELDFALVKRHTDLSERIRAPRYPFRIDKAVARRGAAHYQARCATCHDGAETDARLYPVTEVGTEPQRAQLFSQAQADYFDKFLAELETAGYQPPKEPGIRSTQKYWAASLPGVWARSPYLHNGSVRTMQQLLLPPSGRAKSFHRGSNVYDQTQMGYADEGSYVLDTATTGNSNAGHDYGTDLSDTQKLELIEHLKTL